MSSASWRAKGLTCAPKCLFPSRGSISLRRLLSITMEYRQSDTDITTSWAMKGRQFPLLHCCGYPSGILYFLLGNMYTLTRWSFELSRRCLSQYDPLESAALLQLAISQEVWNPAMLNKWIHFCYIYTDCSFPRPCMSDMNVFRNRHSSGLISSSEGKSDPSKKLQDPEIGKCS